ncbi:SPOSA6832_03003, partial [Sporobolomyces salmonicolor]
MPDHEEDRALRAADELLAEDELRTPFQHQFPHRRASSIGHVPPPTTNAPAAAPRDLIASLTAAVLASTLATHQLRRVARHSRLTVLAFPLLHYGTLGAIGLALGCLRPRGAFGGGARIALGRGSDSGRAGGERGSKRLMGLAGASSAIAFALRLWSARWSDQKLCEALDLFVLPTLLVLAPYLAPILSPCSLLPQPVPSTLLSTCAFTTFLVGFALIGVPATAAGLVCALLRLPMEALSLLLVKEGLSDEGRAGDFLMGSAAIACITSLVTLPLVLVFPARDALPTLDSSTYLSTLFALAISVLAEIALLVTLHLFSQPLTAAGTLFTRNFLLLVTSTFGRDGVSLRENWMQIVFVCAFGSAAVAWADPEISSAVRGISSKGPAGYELLNSNGHLPMSSPSRPSSPSLNHPSPPPNVRKPSSDRTTQQSATSPRPSFLAFLPFIPLLVHVLQAPATSSSLSAACSYLPPSVRSTFCHLTTPILTPHTVDVVVSYYDESLETTQKHLADIRAIEFVAKRSSRVVIYNKGARSEKEIRQGLQLKEKDEVVPLENVGREGATYLKHILLHYNATLAALSPDASVSLPASPSFASALAHLQRTVLADHTFFLQPHLAWGHIAAPRLQLMGPDTGFAHFGPYIKGQCGQDKGIGIGFPVVKELFNIFVGEICPPTGQTVRPHDAFSLDSFRGEADMTLQNPTQIAWSAQFAVSKHRILANSYERYAHLDELMEAPVGHWIHDMWGPNESGGPSNPAVGHSVERAWPTIFGCWDPRIADECPDDVAERDKCQCLDS